MTATSTYNPNEQPQTEEVTHMDELRLLSVNEARKILRVSHSTLKQLINSGIIKSVRVNTRYKISYGAIKEFSDGVSQNSKIDITIPPENAAGAIMDELINDFKNKK